MCPELSPTAQLLADCRSLTLMDLLRLAGYAALILAPLALAFLSWLWSGPSMEQALHP